MESSQQPTAKGQAHLMTVMARASNACAKLRSPYNQNRMAKEKNMTCGTISLPQRYLVRFNTRKTWVGFQMIISTVLLYLLFRRFEWRQFIDMVATLPLWSYTLSVLLTLSCQFLYVFKWDVILRVMGIRVPYGSLVRLTFVGFFFANFAPSSLGQDVAKVYYLGREKGYWTIGASVAIDRFLGIFSMVFLAMVLIWSFEPPGDVFRVTRNVLTLLFAGLSAGMAAVHLPLAGWMVPLARRFPKSAARIQQIEQLIGCLRRAGSDLRTVAVCIFLVGVVFCLMTGVYMVFFRITLGIQLGFAHTMAVILVVTILSNLPIALNGIGVREQSHYVYLAALGLTKEVAVGMSLLIFSHTILFSMFGLILWLSRSGPDRVVRSVRTRPTC